MLIRISRRVEVTREDDKDVPAQTLKALDGAASDGECSDYLDSDLADLAITGGAVKLVHDPVKKCVNVVTEYTVPKKLKPAQLKKLVNETVGQWSDGIGEGCFDAVARKLRVTIDLAPWSASSPKAEQIDDGRPVRQTKPTLARAAEAGDLDAVKKLCDAGADLDARLQGFTPLHLAILYAHADVALELIARGADIRAVCKEGYDALFMTASARELKDKDAERLARVLLERGVNPGKPRGWDKVTVLEIARNRKKNALAKALREYGAGR